METRKISMYESNTLNELMRSKSHFCDEYYSKVVHDFSCYVFLMLKLEMQRPIDEVVRLVSSYPGYQGHKGIRYKGEFTSHFYVKFQDSTCAKQAATEIKSDPTFTVNILSSILQDWYFVEKSQGQHIPWTHTVIEFVGMDHNALAIKDNLIKLLDEFGAPRTISYINNPNAQMHMLQVLYSSLAEALGATIALGLWYQGSQPVTNSFYRMKILLSDKEHNLIQQVSVPNNHDFTDLEYFIPNNITEFYSEMDAPFGQQQYDIAQFSSVDFQSSAFQTLPIQKYWSHREFRNNNRSNKNKGRGGRSQRFRQIQHVAQDQIPHDEFPDIKSA